ncbi:FtsX-like permease family protein [Flavobacteriaceae bacterium R33]|uniref:FtsX-like permease family protein n=2 Tax=Poritiphilus flavus TaxID=2697053 RepID=A0A6L9EF01_9FLAO|nr:FtsX-like permease family protein [Poritiphilus flavus]
MAWRDGKASARKLFLFMASIVMGIGALVSIQSFGDNLTDNISQQSKSLMGADYIIDSNHPPNEKVAGIIDSLGGEEGKEISFVSMVAFPKNGATKLAQVRGIAGDFPFYGSLETEPEEAGSLYQSTGKVLVDGTVMLQYRLKPGDSIKIGTSTLEIAGSLKMVPGRSAISSSIAPAIFMPYDLIEATGLLQRGSRVNYSYYFLATPSMDLEKLYEDLDPVLDAEGADMDTHLDTSRNMGRSYSNFGKFLNLVAFIALLLGCVGIASAIHIYIREKLSDVAVLKCIGATRKQTFLIYLLQIAVLGIFGGIAGAALGIMVQQLAPLLLQDLLPVDIEISISGTAVLTGVLLGFFMAVLFALLPLVKTWFVSPLHVLRAVERPGRSSLGVRLGIIGSIFFFILLFSFWLLDDINYSVAFVLGILVTFALLVGLSSLLMRMLKNYFPLKWGFCTRQSIRNLHRPNNQTTTLILAIGVGTFLISTLYFTKDILLSKLTVDRNEESPNIILLDVQRTQTEEVADAILPKGLPVIDNIPIITMRVHGINGQTISEIRKDSTSRVGRWVMNHEFRVTYRDSLIASETVRDGTWTGSVSSDTLVPISVAENFANDARVKVGDRVVFNVQGVLINTLIGSIREVDWGRLQLNFSVVFPEGVLEKAPQFNVLTTNAPDEATSASLQRELVRKFPNVSIIDLRQMLNIIENILNKISWVINFMALFSILTGIVVLIASVRTSKYQRVRESVMLRTIGARGRQIRKITLLEYVFLGVLGSFSGIVLSLVSSVLLARFVFEVPFVPSVIPFIVLLPAIVTLVVLIGLANSRSVIQSPPMEVLRKEVS